jgi:AAA family ATP:ADP antiporter
MSGYFSIRPVRDTVGSLMGRDSLADLWIVVWLVSLGTIPIYGALVARFRRSVFLPWIYGFIAAALVFVGIALRSDQPSVFAGQFFWVFISVLNLFIISVFWSFLLELFRSEQTKRLFGVIAAGGTAGALAGPLFTDLAVDAIGSTNILFIGAALFVGAIIWPRARWNRQPTAGPRRSGAIGRLAAIRSPEWRSSFARRICWRSRCSSRCSRPRIPSSISSSCGSSKRCSPIPIRGRACSPAWTGWCRA